MTPNLPEAAALCGFPLEGEGDVERAAQAIARLGGGKAAVLVKGGHGAHADDLLRLPDGTTTWLRGERIETANTHGTGCTLSSAIACGLARGLPLTEAVRAAKDYVSGALAAGLDLGRGSGPLDHGYLVRR